jgi:hypothetical protein
MGPSSLDLSPCVVQVLVTQLTGSTDESLHLVVLSFDGYLYLIDGLTGDGLSITSPLPTNLQAVRQCIWEAHRSAADSVSLPGWNRPMFHHEMLLLLPLF